jgi:hypothetical protein
MNEKFTDLVMTTAASLAFKGYLAQHPGEEDAAQAYAVENYAAYLEDAWAWLVDQGELVQIWGSEFSWSAPSSGLFTSAQVFQESFPAVFRQQEIGGVAGFESSVVAPQNTVQAVFLLGDNEERQPRSVGQIPGGFGFVEVEGFAQASVQEDSDGFAVRPGNGGAAGPMLSEVMFHVVRECWDRSIQINQPVHYRSDPTTNERTVQTSHREMARFQELDRLPTA